MTAAPDLGTVADLGTLDGEMLVFGGPYSNLRATRAVRAEAERRGIPPARVLCTGDIVAYCAEAAETAALVRDWGVAVVMGNCEESLGLAAADCGCGFAEGSACDLASRRWFAHAAVTVDAEAKAWMAALPRRIGFRLGGVDCVALHGGTDDIARFLFASTPDAELAAEMAAASIGPAVGAALGAVIAGHCGLPFSRVVEGRLWHNAGVIGMPANDGDPSVWYALLSPLPGGGIRVRHHRLSYDHGAAAAAVRAAGLVEGYAAALETGLWPSLDVLPPAERAATGVPLDAAAMRLDFRP